MKKTLIGASALLLFAACSNDEPVYEKSTGNDGSNIRFSVSAERNTRAEDVFCSNHLFDGFTVYATADGGKVLISGDDLTLTDGTASTDYYWPKTGANFYAISGNDAGSFTFNKDDASTVSFTVNPTVASQKDLAYAVAKYTAKPDDGKAKLNFRHALSQVVFKAKNTNEKLYVVVKSVTVGGVASEGTYTLPTDATDEMMAHPTPASYVTSGRGSWSDMTGSSKFTTAAFGTDGAGVEIPASATEPVNLTVGTDGDAASFANAMLLLPQTTTAYDTSAAGTDDTKTGTYFIVNVEIYQMAGTTFDASTDVQLYTGDVRVPVAFNWEEGNCYVYTLVFGKGNGGTEPGPGPEKPVLVPITFEVSVDEFYPVTVSPDTDINADVDAQGNPTGTVSTGN